MEKEGNASVESATNRRGEQKLKKQKLSRFYIKT